MIPIKEKGKDYGLPANFPPLCRTWVTTMCQPLHYMIMLRLFLHICKAFHEIKHLDDFVIYTRLTQVDSSLFSDTPGCPSCGSSRDRYCRNGSYSRQLICYSNGSLNDHLISVCSFKCCSCGRSHALLPSIIVPYSSYSLGFLLSLIYARITRKFPNIPSLCLHFGISESTYYRIRKRFVLDSKWLLLALETFLDGAGLTHILKPPDPVLLHAALSVFFRSTGHSFLQPAARIRPKIKTRLLPSGYHQIT